MPPQLLHNFHTSTLLPQNTPNIKRVIVEHQVYRPVTIQHLWCRSESQGYFFSGLETGSSVWIFADDWSTYNTEKEQGKQKGKRSKKFRIRPRSSVAPVSSPLHTKTGYGAVSRLPWARLPMVLSWFETPSSRPTWDDAWYLPKERYTEENFRAWTFVISRFKIFLSNVCWAASWEVVPCMCCDTRLNFADVNASPLYWSVGTPLIAPILPLNPVWSSDARFISWQEKIILALNLGKCTRNCSGKIE